MPNKWVEFIKKFAKEKGLSYGCAITHPDIKTAYRKEQPKLELYTYTSGDEVFLVDINGKYYDKTTREKIKKPAGSPTVKRIKEKFAKRNLDKIKKDKEIAYSKIEYVPLEEDKPDTEPKKKNITVRKKATAGEKVFFIPELNREIKSYLPTFTDKQKESVMSKMRDEINYFSELVNIFDGDYVTYSSPKQQTTVKALADLESYKISTVFGLLIDRLDYLIKYNKLKNYDDDDYNGAGIYYDTGDLSDYDYRQNLSLSIDDDFKYSKATSKDLKDNTFSVLSNYIGIMKDMNIDKDKAVEILNKRFERKGADNNYGKIFYRF